MWVMMDGVVEPVAVALTSPGGTAEPRVVHAGGVGDAEGVGESCLGEGAVEVVFPRSEHLVVHSAEWTPAMRRRFSTERTKARQIALLRRYGMGVPDLARATRSAADALTFVAQDVIYPFEDGKMREIHFHELPWPTDILTEGTSAGKASGHAIILHRAQSW